MIFLFFLITYNALAGEAMVTVLEAPIFKEESTESKIVQYVRTGQKIYIDDRDLKSDIEEGFEQNISNVKIPSTTKKIFYKTVDKNGIDAFRQITRKRSNRLPNN
jgi:hypothetical protein